jgi:protein-S-isoprenylcysteine O-methyltransferase Ste14
MATRSIEALAWKRRAPEILASLAGAASAAWFARNSIEYYRETGRLIGAAFFVQQMWVAAAFLLRRRARIVSGRRWDWAVAFGGTFGGVLLRPNGLHPAWGVSLGLAVQFVGLAIWAASFLVLGRSFGFVAADRGVVSRGPYAVVRHPLYAAYFVTQLGYLLQSASVWNGAVFAFAMACNIARTTAEERLLGSDPGYRRYRSRVRWRLLPGVW